MRSSQGAPLRLDRRKSGKTVLLEFQMERQAKIKKEREEELRKKLYSDACYTHNFF